MDRQEAGLASGMLNTSRQVGGSVALAALATLAADRTAAFLRGHPVTPVGFVGSDKPAIRALSAAARAAENAALTAGFSRFSWWLPLSPWPVSSPLS